MKMNRMQALASACCLLVPMTLAAQGTSSTAATANLSRSFAAGSMQSGADTDQDKTFLTTAAQGGMAEIQLGQLAQQKSSNPKVKAFGQKMVTDHTMLNNELKPFADKDGIAPPTSLSAEDQAVYDKLNALSGKDFDNAYIADMMKDHAKDLSDFQSEVASTQDAQLKMTVKKGEKVIAEHKKMADKLGSQMGVTAGM